MKKTLIESGLCYLAVLIFSASLCGCGSGTSGAPNPTTSARSQTCIGCHSRQGAEWSPSAHNTKNGASCADCHDAHPGHPNSCNVCHNGQFGSNPSAVAIRNTGAVEEYRGAVAKYADIGDSNMCLVCHREGDGTVRSDSISASLPFANTPFIRSTDATGGVTLFKKIGYHYYADSTNKYTDADFYHHDEIGIGNFSGTGTMGPCVTCHIGQASEGKRHSSMPIDGNRNLISTVCAKCHNELNAPEPITTADLDDQKDGYTSALVVLAKVLKDKGIVYRDAAPNFDTTNWLVFSVLTDGAQTMGAAFNFNLLWHDYGAYVHNRRYAKRLIFDSIDWMLDGAITGAIEAQLPASTSAGELVFTKSDGTGMYYNDVRKAAAVTYLQGTTGLRP